MNFNCLNTHDVPAVYIFCISKILVFVIKEGEKILPSSLFQTKRLISISKIQKFSIIKQGLLSENICFTIRKSALISIAKKVKHF